MKILNTWKGISKNIKLYILMHCFGSVFLVYSVLNNFMLKEMDFTILKTGAIFTAVKWLSVLASYLFRNRYDNYSPNIGMGLDWILESIEPLLLSISYTPFGIILSMFAGSFSHFLNPYYNIYEKNIFPDDNFSNIYNIHLLMPEISSIIIYPIIGWALSFKFNSLFNLKTAIFICGLGLIFTSIFLFFILEKVDTKKDESKNNIKNNNSSSDIPSFIKKLFIASSFISIALSLSSPFVTTYYISERLNGTIFHVLLIESFSSLFVIIGTQINQHLINKKYKSINIINMGIVFFILYAFTMYFSKNITMIIFANIFKAIGNTLWLTHHNTILYKNISKEETGKTFATYTFILRIISIFIPIVSSMIIHYFNYSGLFIVSALSFIISILIYQSIRFDILKAKINS